MLVTRQKRRQGEVGEGYVGINGDGGDLTWGGEHTIQYTDDVLQNCTPETYKCSNQCHPINSMKI